ncbi:uncharacterized protein EI97DRAFT_149291 [Westerdykella ornata]|uniref:Uncharacterized protein n=1 Tax=Westerdykella ornata TaxID=318751 RepID=A0A6A6JER5_WESOR|nr:uncharacterized protein EI97DRAFT_149291 [Westerdykella ornata]KAF2273669.1 hypothetical protein EI97DRAFT_149291 [Westerdykella ornata]
MFSNMNSNRTPPIRIWSEAEMQAAKCLVQLADRRQRVGNDPFSDVLSTPERSSSNVSEAEIPSHVFRHLNGDDATSAIIKLLEDHAFDAEANASVALYLASTTAPDIRAVFEGLAQNPQVTMIFRLLREYGVDAVTNAFNMVKGVETAVVERRVTILNVANLLKDVDEETTRTSSRASLIHLNYGDRV